MKVEMSSEIKVGGAYDFARRNNLLDEICSHMYVKPKGNREIYKNRKTILYYIKINDVYKIGIAIHEKYKSVEDTIIKYRYTKSLLKKKIH